MFESICVIALLALGLAAFVFQRLYAEAHDACHYWFKAQQEQCKIASVPVYVDQYVLPALSFLRHRQVLRSKYGTLLCVENALGALSHVWAHCNCYELGRLVYNCGAYFPKMEDEDERDRLLAAVESWSIRLRDAANDYLRQNGSMNVSKEVQQEALQNFRDLVVELEEENKSFPYRQFLQV